LTALPAPHRAPLDPVERIAAFMAGFSLEATRPSAADIAALAVLKRGTRVYLSAVPNRPADESVAAAVQVRAAGLEPIPHVAVRNFASKDALDDFLARLDGEAGVDSVLVIAGDRDECGPFRRALDAIDSGVLRRRGIRTIGIAGYPEGHPRIGEEELDRALRDKIAAAEATGLAVEIVSQFCFDARAVLDFIARLRAFGLDHRLRIGLVGPTNLTSLMRYASRCGVRASAQGLARRAVPHFFSFGGVPATGRWARAVADGHVTLDAGGGFRVEPPRSTT
jgi:methylenetetrahydrofolate reductase (NADPH)